MTLAELQPIIAQIQAMNIADPCTLFGPLPKTRRKRGEADTDTTPRMDRPFRVFTPTGQTVSSGDYIHIIFITKPTERGALGMGEMP